MRLDLAILSPIVGDGCVLFQVEVMERVLADGTSYFEMLVPEILDGAVHSPDEARMEW